MANCTLPPLARPLVAIDDWRPTSPGSRLEVPPALHHFRRWVCNHGHRHGPEESMKIPDSFYLDWCEAVGPYLVAVTDPPHYEVRLATRAGRVLRWLRIRGVDPLEDPARFVEKQARAVATAALAVRTLRDRLGAGQSLLAQGDGEAWLRRQLAGLGEKAKEAP